jgi:hypothetical protein
VLLGARNPRTTRLALERQRTTRGRRQPINRRIHRAIPDAPWLGRQADRTPVIRDIPRSTAHSGSRASTVGRLRYPRTGPIEPPGPVELPIRGNRAVLGWGTKPAPPFGIGVASDPTSVPVFHPSCPPVIIAYASRGQRPLSRLLSRFSREVLSDPSPESLLHRCRCPLAEPLSNLFPGVPLAQHPEDFSDLFAMVFLDPLFDQIE